MTKAFTIEVTKTVVITVEAETYEGACRDIENEILNGEHDQSLATAECQFYHVAEENVK